MVHNLGCGYLIGKIDYTINVEFCPLMVMKGSLLIMIHYIRHINVNMLNCVHNEAHVQSCYTRLTNCYQHWESEQLFSSRKLTDDLN